MTTNSTTRVYLIYHNSDALLNSDEPRVIRLSLKAAKQYAIEAAQRDLAYMVKEGWPYVVKEPFFFKWSKDKWNKSRIWRYHYTDANHVKITGDWEYTIGQLRILEFKIPPEKK